METETETETETHTTIISKDGKKRITIPIKDLIFTTEEADEIDKELSKEDYFYFGGVTGLLLPINKEQYETLGKILDLWEMRFMGRLK